MPYILPRAWPTLRESQSRFLTSTKHSDVFSGSKQTFLTKQILSTWSRTPRKSTFNSYPQNSNFRSAATQISSPWQSTKIHPSKQIIDQETANKFFKPNLLNHFNYLSDNTFDSRRFGTYLSCRRLAANVWIWWRWTICFQSRHWCRPYPNPYFPFFLFGRLFWCCRWLFAPMFDRFDSTKVLWSWW